MKLIIIPREYVCNSMKHADILKLACWNSALLDSSYSIRRDTIREMISLKAWVKKEGDTLVSACICDNLE